MGNIDMCTEPELLKVKVPIIFLGKVGFSPPREGRYWGTSGQTIRRELIPLL